ncbi:MAG: hypothetical protein N4A61_11290 [Pelagimonas sp.]|jgi:hypothetical protein|nr:hypothetical protein [Pelagimonas sp.]
MNEALRNRIDALKAEIAEASGDARDELLDRLEEAVLTLESHGGRAPGWAKSMVDEHVEDQFDNMPI